MGRDERKRSVSPSLSPSPSGRVSNSREEKKRKSRKSKTHETDERGTSSRRSEGKKRSRISEEPHKRNRDDREEKKRKKEKKLKDRESAQSGGDKKLDSFEEISKDDYFNKNNEFSTWLKEEKGKFFSELTSETAREMFLSFVKRWNKKKLDRRYYEGIAKGPRCGHTWKIKN